MRRIKAAGFAAAIALVGTFTGAPLSAQYIVAPTSGVINLGGAGFGSLTETFDQSGLLTGYTAGSTNFDDYMALDPQHSYVFSGNEWFSDEGTSSAIVTYSFGSVTTLDRMALWNDEAAGIGLLDIWGSVDGIDFFSLAAGLTPTNHPQNLDYGADVFGWGATDLMYVRMEMSECPQSGSIFSSCSIGEVAFATALPTSPVPEPGSLILLVSGLLGLGVVVRRRKEALKA